MIAGAVMAGLVGAITLCTAVTSADVDLVQASVVAAVLVAYQTNLWWAFQLNGPYVQAIINMNVLVIGVACLVQGTVHMSDQSDTVATAAAALLYLLLGIYIAYTPDQHAVSE